MQSVDNAIKLLQACSNKSVNTGLLLASLVATKIVEFMIFKFATTADCVALIFGQ